MDVEAPQALLRLFDPVEDPRVERSKLHRLSDILVITLCAVICGADTWTEVELFGQAKVDWLRTFLALSHGIPSHDTFGRVFARLNPDQLERCFQDWMQALAQASGGRLIALDGKTIRRSHENPDVQKLYKEFLQSPLSAVSHKYLHTHYQAKTPQGIIPKSQH